MNKKPKQAGDKVAFYRQIKKGGGTKVVPARGRIEWIKKNAEGQLVVAINFRGKIITRYPDQVFETIKPKRGA